MDARTRDTLFGRMALRVGWITIEQLNAATEEQGRRQYPPPLGELFVELGILSQAQVEKLLKRQQEILAEREQKARVAQPEPAASPEPDDTEAQLAAQLAAQRRAQEQREAARRAQEQAQRDAEERARRDAEEQAQAQAEIEAQLQAQLQAQLDAQMPIRSEEAPPVDPDPWDAFSSLPAPTPMEPEPAPMDELELEPLPVSAPGAASPPQAPALDPRSAVQLVPALREEPAPAVAKPKPARVAATPRAAPTPAARSAWLDGVLTQAAQVGASDVHLHAGSPITFRLLGKMQPFSQDPLDPVALEGELRAALSSTEREALDELGQVDLAYTLSGVARFRGNIYKQQRGMDGAFRVVPPRAPTLAELGLPQQIARVTTYHQGIVLFTGPAGCGKSATMAAIIDLINSERTDHILTIEDPIEIVHTPRRAIINQRHAGTHTKSYARALRGALREDPDVIVIGEMRDYETISLALKAAETGHLVLATLHTNSAVRTINRIIGAFPPNQQGQARSMLSESLRAVISQRLIVRADGSGRVPALEVLYVNPAVGNLIRDNRTVQLRSVLQTQASQGMCLLDASLADLIKRGIVKWEDAAPHAEDPKKLPGAPPGAAAAAGGA